MTRVHRILTEISNPRNLSLGLYISQVIQTL